VAGIKISALNEASTPLAGLASDFSSTVSFNFNLTYYV